MSYWTEVDPPMSFVPEGWTFEQKRAFRRKIIPYLADAFEFEAYAGKRVLCVGDGSGIDAVEFALAGASVSVVDASEKAIALTRRHFVEVGISCEPDRLAVGDVSRRLPWLSESFDAVYSFGVYHHIPEVERALAETARVLKPEGVFTGMVYHKDSLLYAYSIMARAYREHITPALAMQLYSERNPGCPHSVAYTEKEWENQLLRYFSSSRSRVCYDVIDLPERRKVPFKIEGEDRLGWHLVFRATK